MRSSQAVLKEDGTADSHASRLDFEQLQRMCFTDYNQFVLIPEVYIMYQRHVPYSQNSLLFRIGVGKRKLPHNRVGYGGKRKSTCPSKQTQIPAAFRPGAETSE